MKSSEIKNLQTGAKLLVADKFTNGSDDDIKQWLGQVITLDHTDGTWIYFKEDGGNNPFRYDEIVCVYNAEPIDDGQYEIGDIGLLLF